MTQTFTDICRGGDSRSLHSKTLVIMQTVVFETYRIFHFLVVRTQQVFVCFSYSRFTHTITSEWKLPGWGCSVVETFSKSHCMGESKSDFNSKSNIMFGFKANFPFSYFTHASLSENTYKEPIWLLLKGFVLLKAFEKFELFPAHFALKTAIHSWVGIHEDESWTWNRIEYIVNFLVPRFLN